MVKTYKHLYPKIYDFANLYRAHRLARRGGTRTQPEVAACEPTLLCAPSPPIQTLRALISKCSEPSSPRAASAGTGRITP
jgi:hypothetical protein